MWPLAISVLFTVCSCQLNAPYSQYRLPCIDGSCNQCLFGNQCTVMEQQQQPFGPAVTCVSCLQCLTDKLVRKLGVNSETLPVLMGGVLQVN
jgi:hypothetical protein